MDHSISCRSIAARTVAVVLAIVVLGLFGAGEAQADSIELPSQETIPFLTQGDFVHISNTPPASASAHGWSTYDGPTELKADVTVQLQVNRGGTWVDVGAPGVERVRPGGSSADRSNARVSCVTAQSLEWRSIVDVDVVGEIDGPAKLYTALDVSTAERRR